MCFCCWQSSYYGYYPGGGACSLDPLTTDFSHKGWLKVAAGDGEFQKSLGCGMCVEIKGQGILADLARRGKIPKTPIVGPIYAIVIDRCGNCKQGNKSNLNNIYLIDQMKAGKHLLSIARFRITFTPNGKRQKLPHDRCLSPGGWGLLPIQAI